MDVYCNPHKITPILGVLLLASSSFLLLLSSFLLPLSFYFLPSEEEPPVSGPSGVGPSVRKKGSLAEASEAPRKALQKEAFLDLLTGLKGLHPRKAPRREPRPHSAGRRAMADQT